MARKRAWQFPSLEWIHRVREEHYHATKELPLEGWLKRVDPVKAAQACRRLGIKVRVEAAAKKRSA